MGTLRRCYMGVNRIVSSSEIRSSLSVFHISHHCGRLYMVLGHSPTTPLLLLIDRFGPRRCIIKSAVAATGPKHKNTCSSPYSWGGDGSVDPLCKNLWTVPLRSGSQRITTLWFYFHHDTLQNLQKISQDKIQQINDDNIVACIWFECK